MQYLFRNCMILILCLGMMGALAYTVGLIQDYIKEERFSAAYGTPQLYEDEVFTLKIMLWQGKEQGDPNSREDGISPSGDLWKGNVNSFSFRMLKHNVTVDSIGWTGWNGEKYMYPHYGPPTLQIENKTGGEILVTYEYPGYGNVIYFNDLTRRPVEYENWLQDQWFTFAIGRDYRTTDFFIDGRYDVFTDYSGMATGVGEMVLTVGVNPFWYSFDDDHKPNRSPRSEDAKYPSGTGTSFLREYPEAPAYMNGVFRAETTSYLHIYAMSPEDADEVITSATVRLVHYSPWYSNHEKLFHEWNQDSLSYEQRAYLETMDIGSYWGCEATLTEYVEELRIVE